MESRATTPEPIEKEAIADLKFPADEILKDAEANIISHSNLLESNTWASVTKFSVGRLHPTLL